MTAVLGSTGSVLTADEVATFVAEALGSADLDGVDLDGASVCLVLPDATRTCPLPLLLRSVHAALAHRVERLTALIALGTHAAMTEDELARHLGYAEHGLEATYPRLTVTNHEWWDEATFASLGTLGAARIAELSDDRLAEDVEVRINRLVVEHDVALVLGPVFPHEVVGFSGGNKYFFPGVAAPEVIDLSHWLGALISSREIIGTSGITPVRALIDEAASLIPSRRLALCAVVASGTDQLHALALGAPEEAWAACAEVSAGVHVRRVPRPVTRVLSVMPERYRDLWTAAKGFYKVEPVVADGGEVIIYAPHVTAIAPMHPEIEEVGYHCRDYFLAQWDRFSHLPWGVLAHSTHLRGAGTYDAQHGERSRVRVTLATGIPEAAVRGVGLGYLDPARVDVPTYEADPDTLVVHQAGEVLFRLA
jgi:nickel-dependent lactate racemase